MLFKRRPKQEPLPELKPLLRKKKAEEKGKRSDGRWMIVIFFGLTVLLSLFFYLKTELPLVWEKLTSPFVISTLPEEAQFDPSPVLAEIKNLTGSLRGTYGVYVYRFDDQNEYGLHEEEVFPAASLVKLPVILSLYRQAEKGEIDLENKYALAEQDRTDGAGILQGKPVNSVYTYRQLAELMGHYSDNTAFRAIRRILGDEPVEQTIKELGMLTTSLKENETTPKDTGTLFKKFYQEEAVNADHREEILGFLTETSFEDRIPAGVPAGIRVAHKIGTEIGSFSDAGIIFADPPAGGFVLVIMSKNARESEAKEALPQIARAVWEFEALDKF